MSSSKKTSNYQLNQWTLEDKPHMDDFNADNARVDQGIQGVKEAAGNAYSRADYAIAVADQANQNANNRVPYSGGTMWGMLIAQANVSYDLRQVHNSILSPNWPSGGAYGDIWFQYS